MHFATHGLLAGETEALALSKAEPALLLVNPYNYLVGRFVLHFVLENATSSLRGSLCPGPPGCTVRARPWLFSHILAEAIAAGSNLGFIKRTVGAVGSVLQVQAFAEL